MVLEKWIQAPFKRGKECIRQTCLHKNELMRVHFCYTVGHKHTKKMTREIINHHILETSDFAGRIFGNNLFVPRQVALHALNNNMDLKEPVALLADQLTHLALKSTENNQGIRRLNSRLHHELIPTFLLLGHIIFEPSVYKSFRVNVYNHVEKCQQEHEAINGVRELLFLPEHPRGLGHHNHLTNLHESIESDSEPSTQRLKELLTSTVGYIASFGANTSPGTMVINGTEYIISKNTFSNGHAFQITRSGHGATVKFIDHKNYSTKKSGTNNV